jgi:hypothetical protein
MKKRLSLIIGLITRVVKPAVANEKLLESYHSKDYIGFLKKFTNDNDEEKLMQNCSDDYGIGF